MSHPLSARLFIALELPEELCAELATWARTASGQLAGRRREGRHPGAHGAGEGHGLRLLDPESMHITICFLGTQPLAEVETLSLVVERCAQPVRECSLGAPLWLPPRRPRALAVEVHDDSHTVGELYNEVLAAVQRAGIVPADPGHGDGHHQRHRPLRPHVTVARMRSGAAPTERALPPTPQLSFRPQRLTLYRSWLNPDGASYESLASYATLPLAASG
ncbi:MAG TPA: RNA 2',3'-cyclic phosphodiesterase [Solirubrobacteraceae bacterium]|jgi:2'-5' RNA ligase